MTKAVLFDLDGTLINSLEDLATSANYALERFGFPVYSNTEDFKYFIGDGMYKLIERVLPENKREDGTIKEVLAVFMEHYGEHYLDKTYAYSGVLELVNGLKAKGIKVAVVSNKAEHMALAVTKKTFGDIFDIICGKREGYPAKPDPALTLEVIKELNVTPNECLFIGDSGMDMKVAVNAGCIGVGVTWGFRERQELLLNGAKFIVNKPEEILSILMG